MSLRSMVCRSCLVLCQLGALSSCGAGPALPSVAAQGADTLATKKAEQSPLQVALTFDDLPAHGPQREGQSLVDIHRQIVETLEQHNIYGAYGFINGAKVAEHAQGREVLQLWRDAGQPLGNHTWAHSSLDDVGAKAFIEEIDKNDGLLAELMGTRAPIMLKHRQIV